MAVEFNIAGQDYIGLNGGPYYSFSPATSLFVHCDTQEEVDRLWDALADGGKPLRCGWITDRFGLTWQIVPRELGAMLETQGGGAAKRVMQAMMGMVKLDLPELRRAFAATTD